MHGTLISLNKNYNNTFTFMHLADTFIQSDLHYIVYFTLCIQAIHLYK